MGIVLAAVTASVMLGAKAGTRDAADVVVRAMLWCFVPFATFVLIARLHLTAGVGFGLVLAYAELALVGLAAYVLATRVLRLSRPSTGALIVTTTLGNTGYLGVPLAGALLGTEALAPAVAWDTVVSGPMFYVVGFAIGAGFGASEGRRRLHTVTRNPPLLAALAGFAAPDALAPDVLVSVAHVVVFALLPAGFFVLGVHLAHEGRLALTRPVATALGLRLVLAPVLLLALAALVVGVPRVYVMQAAMPSGINSLIVAHAFGLDLGLTASAVAWSTAIVVATAAIVAVFS